MTWILILFFYSGSDYPVAVTTQEFTSQQKCEDAGIRSKDMFGKHKRNTVSYICTQK